MRLHQRRRRLLLLLLLLLLESMLSLPKMWKAAEVTPLRKRGLVLDPNNFCMLAVNGTMYRLYVNVLMSTRDEVVSEEQ